MGRTPTSGGNFYGGYITTALDELQIGMAKLAVTSGTAIVLVGEWADQPANLAVNQSGKPSCMVSKECIS